MNNNDIPKSTQCSFCACKGISPLWRGANQQSNHPSSLAEPRGTLVEPYLRAAGPPPLGLCVLGCVAVFLPRHCFVVTFLERVAKVQPDPNEPKLGPKFGPVWVFLFRLTLRKTKHNPGKSTRKHAAAWLLNVEPRNTYFHEAGSVRTAAASAQVNRRTH